MDGGIHNPIMKEAGYLSRVVHKYLNGKFSGRKRYG